MPAFSTSVISSTALTGLATYVTGLATTPTTGPAMYALDGAVCHGSAGQGTNLAPSLAGVPAATSNSLITVGLGSIMPAYSTTAISNVDLGTLTTYIEKTMSGGPPADGWGVYAEYCARCHGTNGKNRFGRPYCRQ